MASRTEFESVSRPRQGLMIGRYTTGTTELSYLEALYNDWVWTVLDDRLYTFFNDRIMWNCIDVGASDKWIIKRD